MRRAPAFENLFRKLRNHPDRHALQQELRQNQAYNLFSQESKRMIQEVGNIEIFELLDGSQNAVHSMPITLERRHRLLHMRAFLAERNRGQSKFRLIYDGPSFSSRIRHQEGKTSWPQIWEKARRQRISSGKKDYKGIHDRFLSDHDFRARMIENNRDEEVCRAWDVLADEDHTSYLSEKSTSTSRTNGGSISISRVLTLSSFSFLLQIDRLQLTAVY